jgi:hypothetical protein
MSQPLVETGRGVVFICATVGGQISGNGLLGKGQINSGLGKTSQVISITLANARSNMIIYLKCWILGTTRPSTLRNDYEMLIVGLNRNSSNLVRTGSNIKYRTHFSM